MPHKKYLCLVNNGLEGWSIVAEADTPAAIAEEWRTHQGWASEIICVRVLPVTVTVEDDDAPATKYEYWRYIPSGETWAIRLEQGQVTGSCGPLNYKEITDANLPNFEYDDQLEDVPWVCAALENWAVHTARYEGEA